MNHQSSSVQVRELFAFDEDKLEAAMAQVGCTDRLPDAVSEMVILSTCNRVEVYAVAPHLDFSELEQMMAEVHQGSIKSLRSNTYRLSDQEACRHLLHVAAGLDSVVIGEPQILGQVAGALEKAIELHAAGKLLSRLFYTAIHAGKRARSETAISQNAGSIPSLAVRLAEGSVADLAGAQVTIMGAGEMAELAVEAFRKRGVNQVLVINRTLERAQQLAKRWNGEADTILNLGTALSRADVFIASTSAPHTLVHSEMVRQAMLGRPDRPLVIIDIAVPRDVDPKTGQIPNVRLYDMDALQSRLELSLEKRLNEIPRVEVILEEEEAIFMNYYRSLDLLPVIAGMRQKAEKIRQKELERTLKRLPGLTQVEREQLEAMTQAMVQKILHDPILRLRDEAGGPKAAEYAGVVRSLFDLGEGGTPPAPSNS
jgi:glutamyl-tRNA reductase